MNEPTPLVVIEFRKSLEGTDLTRYLKNVFRKSGEFPNCIIKEDGRKIYACGVSPERFYESLEKQIREIAADKGLLLKYDELVNLSLDLTMKSDAGEQKDKFQKSKV